jgi:hypothetical protein
MIYVECYPDTVLVRTLTGLGPREIGHEGGKSKVVSRVSKGSNTTGLVDEDPLQVQPPYLLRMETLLDEAGRGLRLLRDSDRANHIVVLCPRLEDWVVRAAREAGVNLDDYSLPGDARLLHRVIKERLSSFQRLVEDLRNADRLRSLHGLLSIRGTAP